MNLSCLPIGRKLLVLTVVFLSVIFSGCENNISVATVQLSEIDFELVILDYNNVESAVFESETGIKLALKLINNSNQDLEWNYGYSCELLQTENFLFVYQLNQGNEQDANYLPVGTPYRRPINCLTINLPPQRIPPGESLIIKLSWSDNPENKPLSTGKYYVVSSFELKIQDQSREWDLRTDFEIL